MKKYLLAPMTAAIIGLTAGLANAGELVINTDASDPAPKAAFQAVVDGFMKANPDVTVKINTFDHEGYKTSIRNFLSANPPDVCW
jgi:multiple sugar transport system substrate-binding protein